MTGRRKKQARQDKSILCLRTPVQAVTAIDDV